MKSFHSVTNRRDGCTMLPFSRSRRKFRFKSAGFHGAEVVLPFNTGGVWKL
jgi:hypothetical protein